MTRLLNKFDKVLLVASIIMFVFGLFMIFDASSPKAELYESSKMYYFYRQLIIMAVSLFVSFWVLTIPTKKYVKFIIPIAIGLLGLLGFLLIFGNEVNGAKSWINLPFFSLQPSEFAKIGIIIIMSVYYGLTYKKLNKLFVVSIPLIIAAVMFLLIVMQPDAGTALIFLIITASLFYMSPIQKKHKLWITLIAGGLIFIAGIFLLFLGDKILSQRQISRFNFLKPCTRYQEDTGYQVCNGYIAINSGKLFSISPGNSKQVYLYLPEAHTDFIFPILVEEFGLITGIVVLLFYMLIIYRIILVGKRSNNIVGQMLCFGVAIYLFAHVVINLVGVLGLLPLTGVPLPFLSYGGSFALSISVALTIVQRVSMENYDERKRKVLN